MYHLAIETSGIAGSVSILQGETPLHTFALPPKEGSGRTLAPAIAETILSAGLQPGDLSMISLVVGPGSFTGLRVGVATAKALAFGLRIPLITLDTLHAISQQAVWQAQQQGIKQGSTAVAIDAYRGEIFRTLGEFGPSGDWTVTLDSHCLIGKLWQENPFSREPTANHTRATSGQVFAKEDSARLVAGSALTKYPILEQPANGDAPAWIIQPAHSYQLMADTIGRIAWKKFLTKEFADPMTLVPRYLRDSAAEEKKR